MTSLLQNMANRFRSVFLSPHQLVLEELTKISRKAKQEPIAPFFTEVEDGETLQRTLAKMIAAVKKIEAHDVNEEYIRTERQQSVYPTMQFSIGSETLGGYNSTGLKFLSRAEMDEIDEKVSRRLHEILGH